MKMSSKNFSIYIYFKKNKKSLMYMNAVKQQKLHILSIQKMYFATVFLRVKDPCLKFSIFYNFAIKSD